MLAIVYVICIVYWNSVCACVWHKYIFIYIYKLFICAWTVCPSMCIYHYALLWIVFCVVLYISYALSKWILCKMLSYIIVIVRSVFVYGRPNSNNSSRRYIVIRRICEWVCVYVCVCGSDACVQSFVRLKMLNTNAHKLVQPIKIKSIRIHAHHKHIQFFL